MADLQHLRSTVIVFSLLILGPPAYGARILGVFSLLAKSHHQFIHPLMATLAQAGHEVVVYSHFPHSDPPQNYTDMYMGDVPAMGSMLNKLILDTLEEPYWRGFDTFYAPAQEVLERFLENEEIKKLINSKEKFDLLISETFSMQEFTLILGHIFNIPVIGVQSFATSKTLDRSLGNPFSLSYIPDVGFPFSSRMTFLERLQNAVFALRGLWYIYDNKYLFGIETTMRRYFPEMPPLRSLTDNLTLIFVNDHMTADHAQPRTPNIIPVAGIHIGDAKPLPVDIQKFMDDSPDGVILFSLGTYVPDDLRPREYFSMFSRVFQQLRQRVLWKTRKEDIKYLPENVKIVDWLPQRDVMAHSKCVLFITHGGLLSQHETIHLGVPVVVIPHFLDQNRNAKLYQEREVGVSLDLNNLTEMNILAAVREVIDDRKYKDNMERLSRVFRDRPLSPRDTVVFWTDYVLRHGGTHLRPASTRLAWYQLALLDVIAVMAIMVLIVLIVVYYCFKTILRIVFRNRGKRTKEKRL